MGQPPWQEPKERVSQSSSRFAGLARKKVYGFWGNTSIMAVSAISEDSNGCPHPCVPACLRPTHPGSLC